MSMPFYVAPEQQMKDRADYARKGKGADSEAPKDATEKKESSPKSEAPAKESTKKASGKAEKSSE